MGLKRVAALAVALVTMVCASTASAQDDVNSKKLRKAVKAQKVFGHQADLETIANANDDNRDTRTPGYQASVDYVVEQLESYGYDPDVVTFNLPEWVENSTPVLARTDLDPDEPYVPGTAAPDDDTPGTVDFITFELSPSGELTDVPVVPTNDVQIPSTGGSTSGCEAGDFPPAVAGAVALIQRGTCPFVQKLELAQEADAAGVILFNEGDAPDAAERALSLRPGRARDSRGAVELRRRKRALPGLPAGREPDREPDGRRADRTIGSSLRCWRRRRPATPSTWSSPARTSTRSRRARGSTTTARGPRRSSRSRSRSRASTSSRARRSASCGSAARRRA